MSSHIPIIIDPEEPSGLECLANAVFLQATDVPEEIRSRLPSETAPISTLLKANIPNRLSDTSIVQLVKLCASPLAPCWTVDRLFETSSPPRTWLYNLERSLSTMWASGTRSIKPPSPQNSNLRFPLWVMNFWNTAVVVAEQRDRWLAAADWLSRRVQGPEIRGVRNLFERVPWGMKLWSLVGHERETLVGYLAELLSYEWLGERHIDTISSYLMCQAEGEPGLGPTTLIAGADLHVYLSSHSRATAEAIQAHGGLRTYTKRILDHQYSRLFIPVNVGENHWVVFSVDLKKQVFRYGELTRLHTNAFAYLMGVGNSLQGNGYDEEINKVSQGIMRWGEVMFKTPLRGAGKTLEIGRQQDGDSCGICVVNSIEHHMFGTPLFTHNKRDTLRIYYFTKAAEFLLDSVRTKSFHKLTILTRLNLPSPTPIASLNDHHLP